MTDFLQVLPQITRTIKNTIFEVLTVVLLKIQVLWNVMLCCQVSSYQQNNRLQGQAVQEFTLKVKALHIFWQSEYLLSWTYTCGQSQKVTPDLTRTWHPTNYSLHPDIPEKVSILWELVCHNACFRFFIFISGEKSWNLTVLLSHSFSTQSPSPNGAFIIYWDKLFCFLLIATCCYQPSWHNSYHTANIFKFVAVKNLLRH